MGLIDEYVNVMELAAGLWAAPLSAAYSKSSSDSINISSQNCPLNQ